MMQPQAFATDYIGRWEGSAARGYYSIDPNDAGNWYDPVTGGKAKGKGLLLDSNFGVTARSYAAYRGAKDITKSDIKALKIEAAVRICVALFYERPSLDRLVWNRATMSLLDFGWRHRPRNRHHAGAGSARLRA